MARRIGKLGILMVVLLTGVLISAFNTQLARASGTIYIRADVSIDSPKAPIQQETGILSEPSSTEWNKTYGGPYDEHAFSVIETSDGGYAITGMTRSYGAGDYDAWLVKTDIFGNMEWNKTYGGPNIEGAHDIAQAQDGGYLLVGSAFKSDEGYNGWIVKTGADGNMEWNRTFGEGVSGHQFFGNVIHAFDGGYAVLGFNGPSVGTWLVRIDDNGNELWNTTYQGITVFTYFGWFGQCLVQTSDGGYALTGAWQSGPTNTDMCLMKTDSNGNAVWNRTFGGQKTDCPFALVEASDGGYALAGYTYSYSNGWDDFYLVKTDASGNMQWNKAYGGIKYEWTYSLVETDDTGYVLAGRTNSIGAGGNDFWLVKTDPTGNMQCGRVYGGFGQEYACRIIETSDGGFAVVGRTGSFGAGENDAWLIKIERLTSNDITIKAHCNTEESDITVGIDMDGTPSGYGTPHTFKGLTYAHTFTVPSTDMNGHRFQGWSTGETSPTITITTADSYVAYYEDPRKYFIIIAGTWLGDKQGLIDNGCNQAFRILLTLGYTKDEIYYLNPSFQDVDSDGIDDRDAWSSAANFQYAIENWARNFVNPIRPLFIYMFDHGGPEVFCIENATGDFSVASTSLESWLYNLEQNTGAHIHVIYAACRSGSFIDDLSRFGRTIITSCQAHEKSYVNVDRDWEIFSEPFWIEIELGHSLGWSFNRACDSVKAVLKPPWVQTPLLDDNADDVGNTGPMPNGGDGALASTVFIAYTRWAFPWISYTQPKQFFTWPPPSSIVIWAKVENDTSVFSVKAFMQPPDLTPPNPDTTLLFQDLESFKMADPDGDGNWTVEIPAVNFTQHASGPCEFRFIITAKQQDKMTAIPSIIEVGFTETGLPSSDSEPPRLSIERPIDGKGVQGMTVINGTVSDNACLEKLDLYLNGQQSSSLQLPPFSTSFFEQPLDTTSIPDGPLNITIKAFDTSNNSVSQSVVVSVNNYIHDINVKNCTILKSVVGKGLTIAIKATVTNEGFYAEQFNVTAQIGSTIIQTNTIMLGAKEAANLTFAWNTTEFDYGNYTVSISAEEVPGETDTTDNLYIIGLVTVTIPGDVDGDFDVDILDVTKICIVYGSVEGDPEYVPNRNINCDGKIDILDVVIACIHYGDKWP